MHRTLALAAVALALLATEGRATGQHATAEPPAAYDNPTDRSARPKPLLPTVGAAGSTVFDPVFASQMWRITDPQTRPEAIDRSYRTPSGTHQNAWSASGSYFYVVSTDGTVVPFAFDAVAQRARRIDAASSGDGGLVLRFYLEPQFSSVDDGVIYGSVNAAGSSLRTIDQFDLSTRRYSTLLDLDTLVPGLAGTYIGGIGSSGGAVERLVAFFGGQSQDRHHYVVVFDKNAPGQRHLLDTLRSTVDGVPANIRLNFTVHHAFIDRSGRYVMVYPTGTDRAAPRNAAPMYVWDVEANTFIELPGASARSNGHDAYGYGVLVNQDCCTTTAWDAAQWQLRSLATPLVTRDLITPVLQPKEVYLADHPSWNDARQDRNVPFITATYRYGDNTAEWRAWDDEIIAVQTDVAESAGATVWRIAHHRSDVRNDADASRISFWYTPRPNVSPDGRWVLFTSNWEKTLGRDPSAEPGGGFRQDVFLVALKAARDSGGPAASAAAASPTSGSRTRRSSPIGTSRRK